MALKFKYWILLGLCILVAAQDMNLTIHGIAHSHNRPGLQMPPEKYYQEYTHKILDNVVAALEKDQSKVFHWDDIASFEKWIYRYPSTDYSKLTRIRKLIKEGRFVFVGGGFVMNDEALPSYKETMLQMRIGRKFLDHYFGIKPTIAWQIGSIGHSAATISVLSKLGYEAIVGNKISSDYKKKLEDEYGFNFYWQGHQVSENRQDDVLLTHILTNDYTSLDAGDEGMVIKSNIQTEKASIYAENIVPSLTSAEVLSNNQTTSIHSMVCLGGDHFFVRAPELFKKYDELLEGLKTEATEVGMKVDAKYSSLYDYFEGLHNSESTFGLFKGDFLPYNEPNEQSEDFWTGYYSSCVQHIRYAFNQLHGLKIILGIIQTSRGTLGSNLGSKKMHRNQYNLNQYIEMAEKKWSSLLHHYAISGIFDQETEKSYSKSYNETLNLIDISLQHLLNSSYPVYKLYNDSFMTKFSQNYSYPSCFDLVYVNPSAFKRHEVMNITIPDEYKNKIVYLILETTLGSKSPLSYITDLYEIDEQTHEMVKVTKLFFELEIEGLSTARLYMYPYGDSTRCALDFINCAEKVTSRIVKGEHHIKNDYTWLSFNENGNLKEIISGQGSEAEEQPIEEQINYYKTDKPSRSSQYTFNPMEEKAVMEFDFSEMHEHELGNLVRILQVYSKNKDDQALKTYSIQLVGSDVLQQQFSMKFEFYSERNIEANLSFKLHNKNENSKYTAYVDDSMKLVERPIYNKKARVKRSNDVELTGFFTYPCVYGGALRTTHNSEDHYFGWSNSHSIGCTFSEENRVEIMIYRKFGTNGHEGLNSVNVQSHVTATNFQFYMHSSKNNITFWNQKILANAKINEPITYFKTGKGLSCNLYKFPNSAKFFNGNFEFGEFPYHVDIVDISTVPTSLTPSKLSSSFTLHSQCTFVLRNRLGENIEVSSDVGASHVLVKSQLVDELGKQGRDEKLRSGCNSNWSVLRYDRPELKTLEDEYELLGTRIVNNFTLRPFEMTQYVVFSKRYNSSSVKEYSNSLGKKGDGAITCEPLNMMKAIRGVPDSDDINIKKESTLSLIQKFREAAKTLILAAIIVFLITIALLLFIDIKLTHKKI